MIQQPTCTIYSPFRSKLEFVNISSYKTRICNNQYAGMSRKLVLGSVICCNRTFFFDIWQILMVMMRGKREGAIPNKESACVPGS